jgi:tetratricopeptide (TPR) repeat protein
LGFAFLKNAIPVLSRRLNVSLRKSLSNLAVLTLAAVALVALSAAPGLAQDQDEAIAYHGWFAANQVQDNAKAVEAAEAYLEKFPTGQYAEFLTKWLAPAKLSKLNEAIKAGQVDQMLEVGSGILANDPENLNVLYALAFQLRRRELLASPRSYAHAAETTDLSKKAIGLVESGKTLAGVQNFDKNATLAWLYQSLAMVAAKDGVSDAAVELYEKSTSLAPQDPQIAGRNLGALIPVHQKAYTEAIKAYTEAGKVYNALPAEARTAAEPPAEVTAARDEVTAARDELNTAADGLIDVAARFVALAEVKNLPQATRDRVYTVLESAYKTRNPEDAEVAGLQAVIDSKNEQPVTPVGGPSAPRRTKARWSLRAAPGLSAWVGCQHDAGDVPRYSMTAIVLTSAGTGRSTET